MKKQIREVVISEVIISSIVISIAAYAFYKSYSSGMSLHEQMDISRKALGWSVIIPVLFTFICSLLQNMRRGVAIGGTAISAAIIIYAKLITMQILADFMGLLAIAVVILPFIYAPAIEQKEGIPKKFMRWSLFFEAIIIVISYCIIFGIII